MISHSPSSIGMIAFDSLSRRFIQLSMQGWILDHAIFLAKQEEIAMAVARARERARASVALECV